MKMPAKTPPDNEAFLIELLEIMIVPFVTIFEDTIFFVFNFGITFLYDNILLPLPLVDVNVELTSIE